MSNIFNGTPFNQDISGWKVFNVTNMKSMFNNSEFNQDISNWCVPLITIEPESFSNNSPLEEKISPSGEVVLQSQSRNLISIKT